MSDVTSDEFGNSPTVEVIVFRDGAEVDRVLCESADEAALVVDQWNEHEGVVCQIDDVSVHHGPDDILEPTPDEFVDDGR